VETTEKAITYSNFEEAKAAPTQLKFIVESTKAGIFSSDVDGYVKSFSYSYNFDKKNMIMRNMEIKFKAQSMDTDGESRDEKLHNLCMSYKEYPEVIVKVQGPLFLKDAKSRTYSGVAIVRGKEKNFKITISQKLENGQLKVTGNTSWSLKEMEIPDPSIAIAKLSDEIRIQFQINESLK
tara:strand:+ start:122945 stop:123484 length:540 start_codon:yes stop_codon:yes gene_type:complete